MCLKLLLSAPCLIWPLGELFTEGDGKMQYAKLCEMRAPAFIHDPCFYAPDKRPPYQISRMDGPLNGSPADAGANVAAARSSGAPPADCAAAEHWSHATEAAKRGSAHGFPRAVCFPAHSLAHGDSAGRARYAQIAPVECFAENAAWSAAFASVAHSAAAAALVLRSRLRSHWLIGGRRANWHVPPRDCSTPQAWELP